MIEAGDKYVYGTAAKKLEYDVYENNKVLKAKKQQRNNNKVKLRMVFNLVFVFSLVFAMMYRYALITEMNYEIDKLNVQYNKIRDENSRLKLEIEKTMNLASIEKIAEEKLGMQKPDKNQIVYVSVPKNDYTIASDTYGKNLKDKGVFAVFFNKIGGLANLLY